MAAGRDAAGRGAPTWMDGDGTVGPGHRMGYGGFGTTGTPFTS